MGELEADALAMAAGWKPATFDHRDLVRHVGMERMCVILYTPDCGTISPGLNSCAMIGLHRKLIDDL
jgi:hypothetical protein